MNARMIGLLITAMVALLAGLGVYMFWIQNSARRVMLSFNMGFAKYALSEPVAAPVLLSVAFLAGLFVGMILLGMLWWRSSSKARRVRQQSALSESGGSAW